MKNLYLLLFLISASSLTAHAQTDNLAIITDMYQRASKFYEEDKFTEAVTLLEKLETLSSSPDAKVLYLKIRTLNSLYQKDASYGSALEKAIPTFMNVAQTQNYPSTKIQEIDELQKQFIASRNRIKSEVEQAKNSGDVNQLKTLAQQQPNSVNQSDIIAAQKEENKKRYEQENNSLNSDFVEANRLMKKSGVGKRLAGILFLGVTALQVVTLANRANEKDFVPSTFNFIAPIVTLTAGLIFLSLPSGRKHGKVLLKNTKEKQRLLQQKYLSVVPGINLQPGGGQYGLAFRLRF